MDRRIARSARKHGITEEDITHALDHSIHWHELDDNVTMVVGPSRSGALLEVAVVPVDDQPLVIHAMLARLKYVRRR